MQTSVQDESTSLVSDKKDISMTRIIDKNTMLISPEISQRATLTLIEDVYSKEKGRKPNHLQVKQIKIQKNKDLNLIEYFPMEKSAE